MLSTESRINARDLLADYDSDDCQALGEEISYLAGMFGVVAMAKKRGQTVSAEFAEQFTRSIAVVTDRLREAGGVENELPLVEAIDLLCRRGGPAGVLK